MATEPIGVSASNCIISREDGVWKITEFPKKKDGETKVYNLNKILESFEGLEGISLQISGKTEIPPDATF